MPTVRKVYESLRLPDLLSQVMEIVGSLPPEQSDSIKSLLLWYHAFLAAADMTIEMPPVEYLDLIQNYFTDEKEALSEDKKKCQDTRKDVSLN